MEGLALKIRLLTIGLDRDFHPTNRILCRLGPRLNVGRRVMMIMLHAQPVFRYRL